MHRLSILEVLISLFVPLSQAEWECARKNNVEMIVVVDVDKFPTRALIKSYVEAGFGWLFENQGKNINVVSLA